MGNDAQKRTYAAGGPGRGLAWELAWRLLTHAGNRFARFVTWVSFLGLSLGVMILTVVVTVMNGFDHELKARLLQSVPHITLSLGEAEGSQRDELRRRYAAAANEIPGIQSVHESFQGIAAVSAAGEVRGVSLYAVEPSGRSSLQHLSQHMLQGDIEMLFDDRTGIVIGAPLARYLGLRVGDPVVIIAVKADERGVQPRLLRFNLIGTFELGAEPDFNLAVVNLDRVTGSTALGSRQVQVQLLQPLAVAQAVERLTNALPDAPIESWQTAYGELFQAVQLEKSMMFVLLLLVVAIASFNIIAGQTMVVADKKANIAILRTMGVAPSLIRRVFLYQGIFISLLGTTLGVLLGLFAAANINEILAIVESMSGRHLLDGSYFVEVPTKVLPLDIVIIVTLSAGLCMLSAWMPARRAAAMNPVAALHG